MLHLYVGPMYAGKTSKLIELSSKVDDKCVVDYQTTEKRLVLSNHDGVTAECFCTKTLADVPSCTTLFINEAQFFEGLKDFVVERLQQQTTVYVFGLDGCSSQKKFGEIMDLIPYCDTVTKLTAVCTCGKPAIFSKRLSAAHDQYLPHGKYVPTCRTCF